MDGVTTQKQTVLGAGLNLVVKANIPIPRLQEPRVSPTRYTRSKGRLNSSLDPPLGRSTPAENVNIRKYLQSAVGQSSEGQANLSSEFLKRHMRYNAEKSGNRSWDLNLETPNHNDHIEDSLKQRERAGISSMQDQCPIPAEEPSGSA